MNRRETLAALLAFGAGATPLKSSAQQIIAAPWREDLCLRVAAALEAVGAAKFIAPKHDAMSK